MFWLVNSFLVESEIDHVLYCDLIGGTLVAFWAWSVWPSSVLAWPATVIRAGSPFKIIRAGSEAGSPFKVILAAPLTGFPATTTGSLPFSLANSFVIILTLGFLIPFASFIISMLSRSLGFISLNLSRTDSLPLIKNLVPSGNFLQWHSWKCFIC